ncbi:MAG TPA: hypothetical protein VLL97_06980 [Acidobacteriota bacterium]|nr:hypothetical protein [Acidobacteriota bacterium]
MPVGMHMQKKELETERLKGKVMMALSSHVGEFNAIGMGELYELATGEEWSNRINDTRKLRTIITALRDGGAAICSTASQHGGGYYIAAAGSELAGYLRRQKIRALKILARNAGILKTNLPNYLGQLKLESEGAHAEKT